jgi:hypothetical protein
MAKRFGSSGQSVLFYEYAEKALRFWKNDDIKKANISCHRYYSPAKSFDRIACCQSFLF